MHRITILLISLVFSCLMAEDKIYFMPYENKKALKELKASLANATESIKIAIYSFTNKEIAKVLRDQAKQGIKITIIYDKESNLKNSYSTIGYLGTLQNIEVCLLQGLKQEKKKYQGIMHHKIAIIDDKIVILGSANWSKSAFENNYENIFITQRIKVVKKTLNYFTQMQNQCTPY